MATPHEIRRVALQALYQLDARGEGDAGAIRSALEDERLSDREKDRAMALALGAFGSRVEADLQVRALAPDWPAHRQPAIDRAILRLGWHEIVNEKTHPAIAINEAVELAKEFSTEDSPKFVNAVLDRVRQERTPAVVVDPVQTPTAEGA